MAEAKPKLNDYQKNLIIKLLGAYFTVQETVDVLRDKYEVELTYQAVYWYWRNRNDEILTARKSFDSKIDVIPIANKVNRLKERQVLIDDLKKNLWSEISVFRDGKLMLDDKGAAISVRVQPKHESVNKNLDSAQKELEPSKVALTDPTGENEFTGISEARRRVEEGLDRILAGYESNGTGKRNGRASKVGTSTK